MKYTEKEADQFIKDLNKCVFSAKDAKTSSLSSLETALRVAVVDAARYKLLREQLAEFYDILQEASDSRI